jgi:hypothetical protein
MNAGAFFFNCRRLPELEDLYHTWMEHSEGLENTWPWEQEALYQATTRTTISRTIQVMPYLAFNSHWQDYLKEEPRFVQHLMANIDDERVRYFNEVLRQLTKEERTNL